MKRPPPTSYGRTRGSAGRLFAHPWNGGCDGFGSPPDAGGGRASSDRFFASKPLRVVPNGRHDSMGRRSMGSRRGLAHDGRPPQAAPLLDPPDREGGGPPQRWWFLWCCSRAKAGDFDDGTKPPGRFARRLVEARPLSCGTFRVQVRFEPDRAGRPSERNDPPLGRCWRCSGAVIRSSASRRVTSRKPGGFREGVGAGNPTSPAPSCKPALSHVVAVSDAAIAGQTSPRADECLRPVSWNANRASASGALLAGSRPPDEHPIRLLPASQTRACSSHQNSRWARLR